uniref:Neur_chan_LBD domain-containing protein n=1 Tax=Steinernema glaseri TaxID=37863 RepID=A0A1I7Y221_9BILA
MCEAEAQEDHVRFQSQTMELQAAEKSTGEVKPHSNGADPKATLQSTTNSKDPTPTRRYTHTITRSCREF